MSYANMSSSNERLLKCKELAAIWVAVHAFPTGLSLNAASGSPGPARCVPASFPTWPGRV